MSKNKDVGHPDNWPAPRKFPTRQTDLLNLHHNQLRAIIAEAITDSQMEKNMTVKSLSHRVRSLDRAMDMLGWRMRDG